jgi:hypothetical protein
MTVDRGLRLLKIGAAKRVIFERGITRATDRAMLPNDAVVA